VSRVSGTPRQRRSPDEVRLPDDQAVALELELEADNVLNPAPEANAFLVWSPGQVEREAISAPGSDGSRLGGLHLIIAVQPGDGRLTIVEDGFAGVFTPRSWQDFTAALTSRGSFKLPRSEQGLGFELVWMPR